MCPWKCPSCLCQAMKSSRGGAGSLPPGAGPSCMPQNRMACPASEALSLLFGVPSYLLRGRAFLALPASTPFTPASCPPAAPMATAKVTDDLLIASSDRHLEALIAVALSSAFDGADPARPPPPCWFPLPSVLLTCSAPPPGTSPPQTSAMFLAL